jgi:hypothetical protein
MKSLVATGPIGPLPRASSVERENRARLVELFKRTPIPDEDILGNLMLYTRPLFLGELLATIELYRLVLDVPGHVMELGVRYGQRLATLGTLRTLWEPHNYLRRVIGFDTFAGLPEPAPQDGPAVERGAFGVPPGYDDHLREVLSCHEQEKPYPHLPMFELRKGDAPRELERFLAESPETVVALAYFDMDLFEPTAACLDLLLPHLVRGSVLAFDELAHPRYRGETIAVAERLGLRNVRMRRIQGRAYPSYLVVG